MPIMPAPGDVHVDGLLTEVSVGYKNGEYIADQIFPIVPVAKQSDLLPRYDQSHWFRDDAKLRGPGTKSQRGGFTVSNDRYYADRYSFGFELPDETRDNADAPYDLERDGAEFVTDKVQMKRERLMASQFFTTTVWGNDVVGGTDFTQWSDYGSSSPLSDWTTHADLIESVTGRAPNTWVVGSQAWNVLKWHPDLIDTIKYTQRGVVSRELVAGLMEVDRILVGRAIYTASNERVAEDDVTYTRIWGKSSLLLYVPPRPSLMTPAAGYTFVWRRVSNAIQYIKRMRDEEREVTIIEANSYFDQKVTAPKAGVFQQNVVA